MGGAVSSGRDNNELIDNLMGGNYIRTRSVERVFRALDRADYMTPVARDQAYKDLAWRNGPLHMSAPCIYSEVMEGLELKPGLSFLNVGSGTGYLSTLVGLIIGSSGISHGIEVHPAVVDYANKKLSQFIENSPILDEFDYCEPKYYCGNGLCLAPLQAPYDRVYCGAGCPEEYQNYFKQLIKVGGILVMPLNDNLLQVKRTSAEEWSTHSMLNVSFASLRVPTKEEAGDLIRLEEQAPARLQALARGVVRARMRAALRRRHPALREPPPRAPPAKKACPRRICIPIDDDSDAEGLNALHDLDRASGATEMNALLSLVLSMGHNRVAGSLRVDPIDSPTDTDDSDSSADSAARSGGDDDRPDRPDRPDSDDAPAERAARQVPFRLSRSNPESDREDGGERAGRSVIMFEFLDRQRAARPAPPAAPAAPPAPADGNEPSKSSIESTTTNADSKGSEDSAEGKEDEGKQDEGKEDEGKEDESKEDESKGDEGKEDKAKEDEPELAMPAEVEIYLGKSMTAEGPSTSTMEWNETETKREHSSDEETTALTLKGNDEKRQKFDSGIGEGNTPSSSSPGDKSDESLPSGSQPDTASEPDRRGRRRQKRAHGHMSTRSSSSTSDEGAGAGAGAWAGGLRRGRGGGGGGDARRVRLSILMKRGVKELPLPYALKKYVNLGRCFEF